MSDNFNALLPGMPRRTGNGASSTVAGNKQQPHNQGDDGPYFVAAASVLFTPKKRRPLVIRTIAAARKR